MSHVDIAATIAPEVEISQILLDDLNRYKDSIDIIELRIDQWFKFNMERFNFVIKQLKTFNFKILVTYRTASQGGKGDLEEKDYLDIINQIIQNHQFDMLDIEWSQSMNLELYANVIQQAQRQGIEIVLSHHNFKETPSLEDLKFIYFKMQKLQPSYLKLAVMPQCKEDVLHLLEAMSVTVDTAPYKVVGIAMSNLGIVSRIAQGVFGGSISYGCLDQPKAPGQIHVQQLEQLISVYHA